MSVNSAQRDVLQALAEGGPKPTSNVTGPFTVSGVACDALEKQGFVTVKELKSGGRQARITAAGKKELKVKA